jgi:hypothetical protein
VLTWFTFGSFSIFSICSDLAFDNKEADLLIIFVSNIFFSILSDKSCLLLISLDPSLIDITD